MKKYDNNKKKGGKEYLLPVSPKDQVLILPAYQIEKIIIACLTLEVTSIPVMKLPALFSYLLLVS